MHRGSQVPAPMVVPPNARAALTPRDGSRVEASDLQTAVGKRAARITGGSETTPKLVGKIISVTVAVPAIQLSVPMNFHTTNVIQKVQDTIVERNGRLRADLSIEKCGLFIPATGVWLDPYRTLGSYLSEDRATIEMKIRPADFSSVTVEVAATKEQQRISYVPETTVAGLVQCVSADAKADCKLFHNDKILSNEKATISSLYVKPTDVLLFRQLTTADKMQHAQARPLILRIKNVSRDNTTSMMRFSTSDTVAFVMKKYSTKNGMNNENNEYALYIGREGMSPVLLPNETSLGDDGCGLADKDEVEVRRKASVIPLSFEDYLSMRPRKVTTIVHMKREKKEEKKEEKLARRLSRKGSQIKKGDKIRKGTNAISPVQIQVIPLQIGGVVTCCSWIEKHALDVVGLFRVSGEAETVNSFYSQFADRKGPMFKEDESPHDVASALKLYLRKLPIPMFPHDMYSKVIGICGMGMPDNIAAAGVANLVLEMPDANARSLAILFLMLKNLAAKSEVNKMTPNNIAIVFGPTLIQPELESPSQLADLEPIMRCITILQEDYDTIFSGYLDQGMNIEQIARARRVTCTDAGSAPAPALSPTQSPQPPPGPHPSVAIASAAHRSPIITGRSTPPVQHSPHVAPSPNPPQLSPTRSEPTPTSQAPAAASASPKKRNKAFTKIVDDLGSVTTVPHLQAACRAYASRITGSSAKEVAFKDHIESLPSNELALILAHVCAIFGEVDQEVCDRVQEKRVALAAAETASAEAASAASRFNQVQQQTASTVRPRSLPQRQAVPVARPRLAAGTVGGGGGGGAQPPILAGIAGRQRSTLQQSGPPRGAGPPRPSGNAPPPRPTGGAPAPSRPTGQSPHKRMSRVASSPMLKQNIYK